MKRKSKNKITSQSIHNFKKKTHLFHWVKFNVTQYSYDLISPKRLRSPFTPLAWLEGGKVGGKGLDFPSQSSHSSVWAGSPKNPDVSTGPLTYLFACTALPCSLCPAVLTRLLARSFCSLPRSWESERLDGDFFLVFFCFGP